MSVRVFRLERGKVLGALKRWAAALPSEVLAVILFGSLARGDHNAFSDADVLLVLSGSSLPFTDRIPGFLPSRVGIPVDVFPYTLAEVREALRTGVGVVAIALEEGQFLRGDRSDLLALIRRANES